MARFVLLLLLLFIIYAAAAPSSKFNLLKFIFWNFTQYTNN